jgi:hypothetical protein
MPKYSNVSAVPLSLAVFLATDKYDHDDSTISATSLIKPVRQLILSSRVSTEDSVVDLGSMVASRIGTAIHDGIENAWLSNYKQALTSLGYPNKVIEKVLINPPQDQPVPDGAIPIYMEQRSYKQVGKYKISGKFDFIGDGRVEDFKTTSVYTYLSGSNDEKYVLQGSLYRWLNPKLITKDEMAIQFIFTDWSGARAKTEANYPPQRFHQKLFPLKSIQETDVYVRNKLALLDQYWDADEADIPECDDADLWRSAPVFKYYKNPQKMTRSTKNFDTRQDAYLRMAEEGNVGIVVEQPGQVTACRYCSAFSVCTQKDSLIARGDLTI